MPATASNRQRCLTDDTRNGQCVPVMLAPAGCGNQAIWAINAMRCFEITINGKVVRLVGVAEPAALVTNFSTGLSRDGTPFPLKCVSHSVALNEGHHQKWQELTLDLRDEIRIRAIDADSCDPPDIVRPASEGSGLLLVGSETHAMLDKLCRLLVEEEPAGTTPGKDRAVQVAVQEAIQRREGKG